MPLLPVRDIACQQAVELISDYLEGALPRRARRRLEAHLKDCPHCSRYLEQMRVTIATMGRVEPETLEPEVRDTVVDLWRRYHSSE